MKVLITKIIELSEDDLEDILIDNFPMDSNEELGEKLLKFYNGVPIKSTIGALSETTMQLIRTKH